MPRAGRAAAAVAAVCAQALAFSPAPSASASPRPKAGAPASQASATIPPPSPSTGVIGLALSGLDTHLLPPTKPSYKPYSTDCHKLLDPAFTGKCVTATSSMGTVAGVVEVEHGAFGGQERDLVWHRRGDRWWLALVHVFNNPGLPTMLWRTDLRQGHPDLVFVMPTALRGFGSELDVIEGNGAVSLYRFLGQGFADVPEPGYLVTYVPGSTEAKPADGYFDQLLIRYLGGAWRAVSQQYVPYPAALRQHKGVFWAPGAVGAS